MTVSFSFPEDSLEGKLREKPSTIISCFFNVKLMKLNSQANYGVSVVFPQVL